MTSELIKKYARFAVRAGVNVQKGQILIIRAPVEAAEFVHYAVEEAFAAGAADVSVMYRDEQVTRARYLGADIKCLEQPLPWQLDSMMQPLASEGGGCILSVSGGDPELLRGIDPTRCDTAVMAMSRLLKPFYADMTSDKFQWSVIGLPNEKWAAKMFPESNEPMEELWKAIAAASRLEGDPAANWARQDELLKSRKHRLDSLRLKSLHMRSKNGTDIVIGLAENRLWDGGSSPSEKGVSFMANIPTEEIFTMPHRARVDGTVKCTKPYVYLGELIDGISLTFKNGRVEEFSAEKNEVLLEKMLNSDEGARHLGEIALVPASSPINGVGRLFYNTLYDENAACHIALGRAYTSNMENIFSLTPEQREAAGYNDSVIHEDLMVGAPDTDIVGLCEDGREVQIFKNGEFA